MGAEIIGRVTERALLSRMLFSDKPEFLALYGRRRVGKSFLVNEHLGRQGTFFELLGSKGAAREVHIARFMTELCGVFGLSRYDDDPPAWAEAFEIMKRAIDARITAAPDERIVLFFDELPWIDGQDSGFLGALDYFWNKYISKSRYKNVLLIVCGSAASWMIRKVINDKGGLHNRITATLRLLPFTLGETKAFLAANRVRLSNRQVCEIYMALGGIPPYLAHVQPGQSSAQAIDAVCFAEQAPLREEFGRLYASLFENHHNHVKIVTALATAHAGLDRSALMRKAGLSLGGGATVLLQELEESGFIQARRNLDLKSKGTRYFLTDEYTAFYLRWIANSALVMSNAGQNLWSQQQNSGVWHAWAGLAFESICFKHTPQIKAALGIGGVLTRESGWYYCPKPESGERGAQVDMVIRRADRTTHLCEMKFRVSAFALTRQDRETLLARKEIYRQATGSTDQIFTTMVTAFGVKENQHALAAVDSQVTLDSLFD